MPNSKTRRGRAMREKANCLTTSCQYYQYCGTLDRPIYEVRNGQITIKGQQYPIKLNALAGENVGVAFGGGLRHP